MLRNSSGSCNETSAAAIRQSFLPLGRVLGVDLYKTERLRFSVDSRLYALLGRKQGADFALEPSLGSNIAY